MCMEGESLMGNESLQKAVKKRKMQKHTHRWKSRQIEAIKAQPATSSTGAKPPQLRAEWVHADIWW